MKKKLLSLFLVGALSLSGSNCLASATIAAPTPVDVKTSISPRLYYKQIRYYSEYVGDSTIIQVYNGRTYIFITVHYGGYDENGRSYYHGGYYYYD